MRRHALACLFSALIPILAPDAALAGGWRPILARAVVADDVVRLRDLAPGVEGPAADAALFAAPPPGGQGVIGVSRVLDAAARAGATHLDATGVAQVIVTRLHGPLTTEPVPVAPAAETAPRSATVVVLTRPVARGETIRSDDLTREIVTGATGPSARGGLDESAIIGKSARRALPAGHVPRESDLARPELVSRGAAATATYAGPGLTLTLRVKALEGGGLGDLVAVQNPASKRTLHGVVAGPGRVIIDSAGAPSR